MKTNWFKIIKKLTIYFFIFSALAVIISNFIVNNNAKEKVFDSPSTIPKNKVGLLLGTSKILEDGKKNLYFTYRVNAKLHYLNPKKSILF